MNVPNRKTIFMLALRQIKTGKSRNLFAIAAIVMTSVLVTAVVTMGLGLMDAGRQMMMKTSGDSSEISIQYLTPEEAAAVATHPLVKEYGVSRYVARADEGSLKQAPLEIRTMDANFADFSYNTPTTGRLPKYENEVAVKTWMLDELGLPRKIGQLFPLSFAVGNTHYDMELTVCGFWDDDPHLHPWGTAIVADAFAGKALTGIDPRATRVNGEYSGVTQFYANLSGRASDLQSDLNKLVSETGIDAEVTSPSVNYAYENSTPGLQSLAAASLILLIIMISGYLLIYNIFYISVIRDIKYYGLLKTIGTTKRQIRHIVNFHALIFCLISIPIGLVLGYLLAGGLFPLLLAMTTLDKDIALAGPTPPAFIAAALLSMITVFISCNSPARIAGRISPIEATRYTGIVLAQVRNTKRHSGTSAKGTYIKRMAFANLFRNRRKTLVALASVSLALILFNIVFTFAHSFDVNKLLEKYMFGDFLVADESYMNAGDSYLTEAHSLTEETVETLAGLDGVTNVAPMYYDHAQGKLQDGDAPMPAQVYGIDGYFLDRLEKSVIEGEFNREKFLSGDFAVVVASSVSAPSSAPSQVSLRVGDMVTLDFEGEPGGAEYEIMAIIDDQSIYALTARFFEVPGFAVILPESELELRSGVDIMSATVIADAGKADTLKHEIEAALSGNPKLDFRSRQDYIAEAENSNRQLSTVGLTLCVVVLLVGILNFFNTTMTNILSRKYEFAILQTIGMTKKQSRDMLTLECMYFVLIAAAIFITIGYAASSFIVRLLTQNAAAYTYSFTILPLLIGFPPLCLIAAVLPRVLYRGISRDSVVERLREIA
ncbi:MAG: ABC transporter permease [Clostridiales Family XIII bacterium]|jgi:putative ABC transport system permease protein|nr:ABC transporter permease [Clostridiales Family XIII bacterium]